MKSIPLALLGLILTSSLVLAATALTQRSPIEVLCENGCLHLAASDNAFLLGLAGYLEGGSPELLDRTTQKNSERTCLGLW